MNAQPAIAAAIVPRTRDLGDGFEVRRVLPAIERRMVGPFVFFDQMGPVVLTAGHGLDVRPHPHIGLATVTYLFNGAILHRDSLGTARTILPGAVNWMTAGSGIVHSERTPSEARAAGGPLYGIQSWVALPKEHEETAPSFGHWGADTLPMSTSDGATVRVIAGMLYGKRSDVPTFSDLFYADATLQTNARLTLPAEHEERAVYIVEGEVELAGEPFAPLQLLVFRPGEPIAMRAITPARLMLLGGAAMDGPRHVWWNFVSSSRERIERAKSDWKARRFATVPGDAIEFIPLPD
jgi:hypothetical protein